MAETGGALSGLALARPGAVRWRRAAATIDRVDAFWFISVSVIALLGGLWFLYVLQIYVGDAIARVAHAHHVLFSRDPHLAAIGFIWPPLPSLVEIPFVALLRPFGHPAFAGQIISSAFTGLLAVVSYRLVGMWNTHRFWRPALTIAILVNPLVMDAAMNGMTENIFMFFVLLATYLLILWDGEHATYLALGALAIGFASFVRYEAFAFAVAGAFVVLVVALWSARSWRAPEFVGRLEGSLVTFLAPVAFAAALWILWNDLFVGDPLYFLHAMGSNEFYTQGIRGQLTTPLGVAYGSLVATARFGIDRLTRTYPVYLPAMLIGAVVMLKRRDRSLFILLVMAAAGPLFELQQVYRGQLFPWVRFWIYGPAFIPILVAALSSRIGRHIRPFAMPVLLAVLLASSVGTAITMTGPISGEDEQVFGHLIIDRNVHEFTSARMPDIPEFRRVATYLDHLEQGHQHVTVLIDAYIHEPLVLFVKDPTMLAIAPDRDFQSLLHDPIGRVNYILDPYPLGVAAQSDINRVYPTLYSSGLPFATLAHEFTDFGNTKLYQINSR